MSELYGGSSEEDLDMAGIYGQQQGEMNHMGAVARINEEMRDKMEK